MGASAAYNMPCRRIRSKALAASSCCADVPSKVGPLFAATVPLLMLLLYPIRAMRFLSPARRVVAQALQPQPDQFGGRAGLAGAAHQLQQAIQILRANPQFLIHRVTSSPVAGRGRRPSCETRACLGPAPA